MKRVFKEVDFKSPLIPVSIRESVSSVEIKRYPYFFQQRKRIAQAIVIIKYYNEEFIKGRRI